jgi:homoaconitase/3-isopropylmalate dehydratase large subunit
LYLVEGFIVYETAATTTGLHWCFVDQSGATWSAMNIFVPNSATANSVRTGALGTVAAGTGTGALTRHLAFGSAVVQAQASPTGVVRVRFQSEVSGSLVTVRAGSHIRYTRLS